MIEQYAVAGAAVIGIVNGIQLAYDRDWKGFIFFLSAVVAGTALGLLHWYKIPSVEVGFAIGLSSSGVYKISKKLGGIR